MIRDNKIDLLKTIGILMIMLAHTYTLPEFLFQFRNFDVILLVLISAMLQSSKSYNNFNEYLSISLKRMLRIILPTWMFLSIFFSIIYVYSTIKCIPFPFSIWTVFESYILINGIGYVWIMLIYIIMAFIGPFTVKINNMYNSKKLFIFIIFIYILYELILTNIEINKLPILNYIYQEVFIYGLGYWFIFYLGINVKKINQKIQYILIITFLIIFGILCYLYFLVYGTFINTNIAKYPPKLYYFSYGLFTSLFLINIIQRININKLNKWIIKGINFIGKNSMWIYLWHILGIYLWNQLINLDCWYLMYLFLIVFSILITYIQRLLIKKFFNSNNPFHSIIKLIFY